MDPKRRATHGKPDKSRHSRCVSQPLLDLLIVRTTAKDLKAQVYSVPEHLDKQIAKLKLESMGVLIDKLTPEQEKYLASWDEGT